ncbi:hypothetical protein J7I94_08990 [Streptomyces sp. ISL-12]|uniref:hypothetical protein n=1 Tax=Streptomyces sp. ISL-12 TaxID=2819177 RepID=UPI001BE8EADB|nr:hypothetical protein [Streptomyces sp. ISL-12]MBT2410694.1 hypothetical protein [Streptomyces sp. ISL-12]
MTTRVDEGEGEGPESGPDDPFLVVLRPAPGHLSAPPGRYEQIRRAASRRRLLRTAAGAGLTVAVAGLVALPFLRAAPERPASPTVPMAPPSATAPWPSPPATDEPPTPAPSGPGQTASTPSEAPSASPTASAPPTVSESRRP